jgi:hypothetical protein
MAPGNDTACSRTAIYALQVVRSFKPPEGVAPGEVDAAGDGEVLVVLDLAQQDDLVEQGLARELVNRWVLYDELLLGHNMLECVF